MTIRSIERVIDSVATSDGAGVKLRRSVGASQFLRHDPFLMLDEFYSDNPDDYLAGFPSHPHRGFETVTYMLDGHMRHEDSVGNRGDLGPGDVQWMSAARGIIHSEMPQQTEGRMRGFQLWINLPAKEKMNDPAYRDIPACRHSDRRARPWRVARGSLPAPLSQAGGKTHGPVQAVTTDPLYLDVHLPAGATFETPVRHGLQCLSVSVRGRCLRGRRLARRSNDAQQDCYPTATRCGCRQGRQRGAVSCCWRASR